MEPISPGFLEKPADAALESVTAAETKMRCGLCGGDIHAAQIAWAGDRRAGVELQSIIVPMLPAANVGSSAEFGYLHRTCGSGYCKASIDPPCKKRKHARPTRRLVVG